MWPFTNQKDPELLIIDLESKDPIVRENAFHQLKDHLSPQTDKFVLAYLQAADKHPREILLPLVEIAGRRRITEALPIFQAFLLQGDTKLRESALQALIQIGNQDCLDVMLSVFKTGNSDLKQKVRNVIIEEFHEEALGGLLRAIPDDENSAIYFELVSIMEDLDLFSVLKENFNHPDIRVREYYFDNLTKFHRTDFIPLFIDFYTHTSGPRKEEIVKTLLDFSPAELVPYFRDYLAESNNESVHRLCELVLFNRFAEAKDDILDMVIHLTDKRFREKCIANLLPNLDPYTFDYGLQLLSDSSIDVRIQALTSLSRLVRKTYLRLTDRAESNREELSRLYDSWEKAISQKLKSRELDEPKRKTVRKLFYVFAENRHNLIKPYLKEFFHNNFHETYQVVKGWSFKEQFELMKHLVTEDPSFSILIISALQGMQDENLWRLALKLAHNIEDTDDREDYISALISRNRNISLEGLIKDPDAEIRKVAIELSNEVNNQGASELLKSAAKDPAPIVRLAALKCLASNRYPQMHELLKEAISDPDEDIAFYALQQIKELMPSSKLAPFLVRFINSTSEQIRNFALAEIAQISKKRYLKNFNNLKPEIRKLAAQVIQKLDQGFSEQIVSDLSSLDPNTRLQSARLLENIQIDEKGKDALLAAMRDPSKLVRAAVVKTLGVMNDPKLLKQLISFFNDPDPRVRANTIEAISSLGDRQAIQTLLPYLEDSNNRIRANAVVAIKKIGNVNVTPVLQKMLTDPNNNMKASALWAMGECNDPNMLNFIYPFFNHKNEMIRFNAIRSAIHINPEVLKPYIPTLRKDPAPKIRKLITDLSFKVL